MHPLAKYHIQILAGSERYTIDESQFGYSHAALLLDAIRLHAPAALTVSVRDPGKGEGPDNGIAPSNLREEETKTSSVVETFRRDPVDP
jgi:hypothetical protein